MVQSASNLFSTRINNSSFVAYRIVGIDESACIWVAIGFCLIPWRDDCSETKKSVYMHGLKVYAQGIAVFSPVCQIRIHKNNTAYVL
jgi:hypothetical protein